MEPTSSRWSVLLLLYCNYLIHILLICLISKNMAEFKLDGRMKVKTLKDNFKKNFGSTLRVYKSVTCKGAMADDDATLASLRAEGAKGGDLVVKGNMQVGNFEKKVAELYGIGVQVANADDSKLADNSITLTAAGK